MSPSNDLQKSIYLALLAAPAVHAICAGRIYDGRPKESDFPCITFGPSDFTPADVDGIDRRTEALQLDCWVRERSGRLSPARALVDAVKAALHEAELALETHALARLHVSIARAFMDADGKTGHGVVLLEADIEEV